MSHAFRRAIAMAGLSVMTVAGFLALAEQPANAVGNVFHVGGTAAVDNSTCGGPGVTPAPSPDHPCATIAYAYTVRAGTSDTINVRPGTYLMTTLTVVPPTTSPPNSTNRLNITKSVTIQRDPATAGTVTIDGNNVAVANSSIIAVNGAGVTLTLKNLTVKRGNGGLFSSGAGIYVLTGNLVMDNVILDGNKSPAGAGGAIFVNAGTALTATGGSFTNNSSANGGAVAVTGVSGAVAAGQATFDGTSFSGNTAIGTATVNTGNGGAIYNSGSLDVSNATFTSNGVVQGTNAANPQRRGVGGTIFNGVTDANDAPTADLDTVAISGAPPAPNTLGTHATLGGAVANVGVIAPPAAGTTPGVLTTNELSITGATAFVGGGIYSTGPATLTGGSIANGQAKPFIGIATLGQGGGLWVSGATSLDGVDVTGNTATADAGGTTGVGGGIYSSGAALTVTDSTVADNTATGSAATNTGLGGGVLQLGGSLTLTDTDVTGNDVTGTSATSAIGGGVYIAFSPGDIDGGEISGNTATLGGGLAVGSATTIDGTRITGNSTVAGGGLYNVSGAAGVTLTDVQVDDNDGVSAGGIWNNASTLTATNLTLLDNTATAVGPGTGLGGGLFNGGTATITGGSIEGNRAVSSSAAVTGLGGGVFNAGTTASLTVREVRATDNHATATAGNFQSGWGGAFYNGANNASFNTTMVIEQSTMDANTAALGSAVIGYTPGASATNKTSIRRSTVTQNTGPGPVTASSGGALSVVESTYVDNSGGIALGSNATGNISGSIVYSNGGPGCVVSGTATVESGGGNLGAASPNDTSCGFAGPDDIFGNPDLGPLDDNGGPTPTFLPSATSPALDKIAINSNTGVNDAVSGVQVVLCDAGGEDQRGVILPEGAKCDIGSVEREQEAPVISGPTLGSFTVGTPGSLGAFSATGSPTPTFSATGLPAGLNIVSTGPGTAEISGTPTGPGGHYVVIVTAENEAGESSLTVNLRVKQAPTTILGPAEFQLIETIDGPAVGYVSTGFPIPTLSLTSGTLPTGVTFTPGPGGTASIDGAPGAGTSGTYNITITASNGTLPNATKDVTITVVPLLTITTTSLPDGAYQVAYGATVSAIGGTTPYTFSLDSGALPTGLTLNADGTITGTPTGAPGTSNFTVKAVDSSDPIQTDTQALSITIGKGPTTLDTDPVVIQTGPFGIRIGAVAATLRGGLPLQPIPGQTVTFTAGATTVCVGVTDANGFVRCTMNVLNTALVIANLGVTATYAGNTFWLPSSDSAGLL